MVHPTAISFVGLLLLVSGPLGRGAAFVGLGELPGGAYSYAYSVSADGTVVTGYADTGSGKQAFRWTEQNGLVAIGGDAFDYGFAISTDGSTIVGGSSYWRASSGTTQLGSLPGGVEESYAYGVSSDGSVIAGYQVPKAGEPVAVRWDSAGSATPLQTDMAGGTYAYAISSDASTIVGQKLISGGAEAFRWTLAGGIIGLGDLPGSDVYSTALAVSSDGSVIVGQGMSELGWAAIVWTQETGVRSLGDLPGGAETSSALAVSADGNVIVGYGFSANGMEAFIWDGEHGMRNLREVLISQYGLPNLEGWTLERAHGISADGQTIVGDGINPQGMIEAWRVTGIPEPSSALLLLCGGFAALGRRPLKCRGRRSR